MSVSGFVYRLVSLTLAFATAAAHTVCACPVLPPSPAADQPVEQPCNGVGDCCRKADPTDQPPLPDHDPCDKCNLKHRGHQGMPDSYETPPALEPALDALPVATLGAPTPVTTPAQRLSEAVPRPPLLQDLFHVHALLLN